VEHIFGFMEHKYEQIGKIIIRYSEFPMLDIISFFEEVLFCFLTENNDMHLKSILVTYGL